MPLLTHNKALKTDSQRGSFFTSNQLKCLRYNGLVRWWRCSLLNAALVCKRKNAAIKQDLVVKAQSRNCRIGVQFQC
ncbi:hypothetical protein D5Q56_24095 [Vibrio parahaemolyticus]|nr:hypothetical protein [Vibrio parahaemolyticus]